MTLNQQVNQGSPSIFRPKQPQRTIVPGFAWPFKGGNYRFQHSSVPSCLNSCCSMLHASIFTLLHVFLMRPCRVHSLPHWAVGLARIKRFRLSSPRGGGWGDLALLMTLLMKIPLSLLITTGKVHCLLPSSLPPKAAAFHAFSPPP